jgi:acyl-CoA thioesterase FadM
MDYKNSILLHDQPEIFMSTSYIGTKSFGLKYEIIVNDLCYAVGNSVLVCFDAVLNETIPVPNSMRSALEKLM